MKRWAQAGALLAPLCLSLSLGSVAGCDAFSGSVVALAITLPPAVPVPAVLPNPATGMLVPHHLQMWAHFAEDPADKYVRLTADSRLDDPVPFPGFQLARAIDPNDQCLIRGLDSDDERCSSGVDGDDVCGASAFSRKAQIVTDGTTADLLQLALVVQARKVTSGATSFNAVDPNIKGLAPSPLLALVRHNPDEANDPRRSLPAISTANAEDAQASKARYDACTAYRKNGKGAQPDRSVPNLDFYVGNPRQYTKPLSGTLFGFFTFTTNAANAPQLPSQSFSGITFSVPIKLATVDRLLVTFEPSLSDKPPDSPGQSRILFQAIRQPDANAGRGEIRMVVQANANPALNPPVYVDTMGRPTNVGTAAILTNLESSLD